MSGASVLEIALLINCIEYKYILRSLILSTILVIINVFCTLLFLSDVLL